MSGGVPEVPPVLEGARSSYEAQPIRRRFSFYELAPDCDHSDVSAYGLRAAGRGRRVPTGARRPDSTADPGQPGVGSSLRARLPGLWVARG
eukprot:1060136-Alexandrium_andersonii.AAC.1